MGVDILGFEIISETEGGCVCVCVCFVLRALYVRHESIVSRCEVRTKYTVGIKKCLRVQQCVQFLSPQMAPMSLHEAMSFSTFGLLLLLLLLLFFLI